MNTQFLKAFFALIAILALHINSSQAQISTCEQLGIPPEECLNVVSTAVPLLRATSEARSGAMGDVGLAISPDANSIYWNAAKLAFNKVNTGVSVSFSPWLRQLGITDIYLSNLSGYFKPDDMSAIAASLRYFSFGNITFTDFTGAVQGDYKPNEFYIDFAYSRKLSTNFGTGLTLKYIHSDLAQGMVNGSELKVGQAVAADLSFFYTNDIAVGGTDTKFNLGLAITNIGNKISYTDDDTDRDFIPTNLGLGTAFDFNFDTYNTLTLAFDVNKLLVPTPISDGTHTDLDAIAGIFGSFGDAPDGGSEELRELMYSVGMEYWYNELFALRAGYFHEHATKGARQYFTMGAGIKYNIFGLNLSYLAPTTGQNHPLARTLRFSLVFDFADTAGTGF